MEDISLEKKKCYKKWNWFLWCVLYYILLYSVYYVLIQMNNLFVFYSLCIMYYIIISNLKDRNVIDFNEIDEILVG